MYMGIISKQDAEIRAGRGFRLPTLPAFKPFDATLLRSFDTPVPVAPKTNIFSRMPKWLFPVGAIAIGLALMPPKKGRR